MNKWISVKDRLPEMNKNILICAKNEISIFYPLLFLDPVRIIIDHIEYWMPLPEQPK